MITNVYFIQFNFIFYLVIVSCGVCQRAGMGAWHPLDLALCGLWKKHISRPTKLINLCAIQGEHNLFVCLLLKLN